MPGVDARHRVVLVLDGAGWHTANDLVLPDGIDLVLLPAASPERQPVDPTWRLLDEPVANRTFADLDGLEAVLVQRCQTLRADPATLRTQACFHWWPSDLAPAVRK
ncbi:MAG: transposase [Chloroflexota bacterium]|nr:transposase [Chloroflexota bacterium]